MENTSYQQLLVEILYYKTNLYAKIPILDELWGLILGIGKKKKAMIGNGLFLKGTKHDRKPN